MSIVSLLPLARSNVVALCNAYCKLIEKFIFWADCIIKLNT